MNKYLSFLEAHIELVGSSQFRLKETAQAFLLKCKKMSFELDVWFIGIHVRRTDYIHHLDVTQDGKPVTKRYFQRAISRMEENLQKDFENVPKVCFQYPEVVNHDRNNGVSFFSYLTTHYLSAFQLLYIVTSDDPGWCKGQFDFKDKLLFHSADAKNELNLNLRDLDMAIAANCNHTIYDYGTFGFWGAYLSGGYTILAQNMGPGINWGIENVKAANIDNWERLDAFAS